MPTTVKFLCLIKPHNLSGCPPSWLSAGQSHSFASIDHQIYQGIIIRCVIGQLLCYSDSQLPFFLIQSSCLEMRKAEKKKENRTLLLNNHVSSFMCQPERQESRWLLISTSGTLAWHTGQLTMIWSMLMELDCCAAVWPADGAGEANWLPT